ncbi:DUF2510 domain-containing protein [Propionibacteriaceae bacterium Y2011]|uniref:DUF2510 domain-containing protein n=1 Tax=Microlunatus sp. Y2014 TaxID=3418488 RepID=UPI003B48CFE0
MNPPGWYPDPAGVSGRLRFWDGSTWREDTTYNPATPFPDPGSSAPAGPPGGGTGAPGAPGGSTSGGKIALLVGIGVVVVALVVAGIVFVPRLIGGDGPPEPPVSPGVNTPGTEQTPGTEPTPGGGGSGGGGGGEVGELNCAGGNGTALGTKSETYTSTGVTITGRADWGFRFDKTQWTWLDDQAAWGTIEAGPEADMAAGVALGGLHNRNGFTEPEKASADYVECLTTYGPWNDKEYPMTEVSSEAVTIGGMQGWQRVIDITDNEGGTPPETRVTIIVLDSGQPARFASLMGFWPKGDATAEGHVNEVIGSTQKG